MFEVKSKDIKHMEEGLKQLNARGIPFAIRNTLNDTAFLAVKEAKKIADKKMTMRNQWSKGSIQGRRATGTNVDRMVAQMGSTEQYMAKQEEGFTKTSTGKHGVTVPTAFAAGQTGSKRTKVIKKRNRMARIRITKIKKTGDNARDNILLVNKAVKTGHRFIYMKINGKTSLYKVTGGSKRKTGWMKSAKIHKVYDTTKRSISIKQAVWMMPGAEKAIKQQPAIYFRQLKEQIDRHFQHVKG
jgi:hypothetical protein